ncbi:MAG: glycosyltransferase [Deltaproteobacteria bacterium]|nr:glycosyltransferase [Deltaproteobacteria bacterium]
MGWHVPELCGVHLHDCHHSHSCHHLMSQAADTFHVFSNPFGFKGIRKHFYQAVRTGMTAGIMSEAGDPLNVGGTIRKFRHQIYRKLFEKHIRFIFAAGDIGRQWFIDGGYPTKKIFDWGYFIQSETHNELPRQICNSLNSPNINIVIVASQISRKAYPWVLNALNRVTQKNWHLHIIGDGPQRQANKRLVQSLGISSHVTFHGALDNLTVRAFLKRADFSLLASHHDGWGVVVNESLLAGTPVICSNACGASAMIKSSLAGQVFQAGATGSLATCIEQQIRKGKLSNESRQTLVDKSSRINATSAARTFLQMIEEPMAYLLQREQEGPWYRI